MPRKANTAAIAEAFAALTREDLPVTVRSLRDRASVGTDAAREWLATNRPNSAITPPPTEALAGILEPLWAAAVAAARDESSESHAAELAAHITSEADALTDLEALRARAAAAEAELTQSRRDLELAHAELADAVQRVADIEARAAADIAAERDRARRAEVEAASAQATAATLREVVNTLNASGARGTRSGTQRNKRSDS
jgi:hypothetical protein